jgi:tellurite resistance protein TerC
MDAVHAFLLADFLGKPAWLWLAFVAIVVALLVFDLGVLHREDREIEVKESLLLSGGYITMGLAFGAWVWWYLGAQSGMEYLTGFMVEKTLAMDNVFVIAMIFAFFAVPRRYQHRVLFWGILGVIVLRAVMIGLGAALVTQFSWVLYLFGVFLVLTGIKMLVMIDQTFDVGNNPVLKFMRRKMRVTPAPVGNRFWVRLPAPEVQGGPPSERPGAPLVWWATPLFFALVLIEIVDVIFAVDSVPAIFAITQDPFIVYTSNIFAILGLRALYFALAAMIHRFRYLKYALAIVLIFIGSKIFAVNLFGKLPAWISLSVTFGLLAGGVLYSLYRTRSGGDGDGDQPPVSGATPLSAHDAR